MTNPIDVLGPTIWTFLQGHALQAPDDPCHPVELVPWRGRDRWRPGSLSQPDWAYIACYLGSPVPGRPYTMAIGLRDDHPVGFVETADPTPSTCREGVRLLREAGAGRLATVCRPTPGGALHARSLMASYWWQRTAAELGLAVSHYFLDHGSDQPVPFRWPEHPRLMATPSEPLVVVRNPALSAAQLKAASRLGYDPEAPLGYVALVGESPVGVASVWHGPLGDYGEDAAARWSVSPGEATFRIKWVASLLMGWGIGSVLYRRIEEDARAAGVAAIVLEAAPFTTADQFWLRHGFRPVERDWRTEYRYMEKLLTSVGRPAPPLSA